MDINLISEATIGKKISYADSKPYIFNGTIRENLLYGLQHHPIASINHDEKSKINQKIFETEARKAGNTTDDINVNWVDHSISGLEPDEFDKIYINEVLETSGLKQEIIDAAKIILTDKRHLENNPLEVTEENIINILKKFKTEK